MVRGVVLTYAMLSGVLNSLICVGVCLNDMLIKPLLRQTHKSPESLVLCNFKVGPFLPSVHVDVAMSFTKPNAA